MSLDFIVSENAFTEQDVFEVVISYINFALYLVNLIVFMK